VVGFGEGLSSGCLDFGFGEGVDICGLGFFLGKVNFLM